MNCIMVDVEADGPIPCDYSMVCFGTVVVEPSLSRTFYGLLRPISWETEGRQKGDRRDGETEGTWSNNAPRHRNSRTTAQRSQLPPGKPALIASYDQNASFVKENEPTWECVAGGML